MKTTCLFFIALLMFTSCKKQKIQSLFGREADAAMLRVPNHPISFCNTGDPIGGGDGYSAIISPAQADVVISSAMSASDFKLLVESSANKTIFINPNITIDLTGLSQTIYLPSNIVIASNRGAASAGAMIKTNNYCPYDNSCSVSREVFTSAGNNIRITGLQFKGPFGERGDVKLIVSRIGIFMKGHDGLEVDNCDIFNWPEAAIAIGRTGSGNQSDNNNKIHHNSIHDNKHDGLGYGVVVDNGFVSVQSNTFKANRHDIACSGFKNSNNTGYEASCNIIMQGGTSHNFDVHGQNGDVGPNASTFFYIHHNYFIDLGSAASRYDGVYLNILVRGIPDNQCRIENNIFRQDGPMNAIQQSNNFGNMLVWNNVYGYDLGGAPGSYLGWYIKPTWNKKGVNNFMDIASSNTGILSTIGNTNIIDYALGDYDGDGKTDIYKIQNGALYVMPYEITNGLTQGWTKILTTEYLMNQLRFGHYNSDNKTDVIVKDGDNIYVSYGCNTSWTLLNSTIYPLSSIHSGDLTGDGIQDFFCAYGGLWMIIDNANPNSNWITIANRNENSNVLKLGWFDLNTTNNKIDVFLANGVNFLSAYDGTQGWWTHLTGSTYLPPSLYICDFNSDGVSDVVNSSLRQVSLKGRDTWANCTTNNFPLSTFPYGDFN